MQRFIELIQKLECYSQADQNRIRRKQLPLYGIEGRFERINQHPVMSQNLEFHSVGFSF